MLKLIFLISQVYLTEEEAVKKALSNSLIKSKIEEINSVNYSRNQVIKSFLPELNSSFTYTHSTFVDRITQYVLVGIDPVTLQPIYQPVEITFGKAERRILNVTLEYLIFSGFQRLYMLKMMNSLRDSKLKEKELKEKEVEFLVRMLYNQGLFLKYALNKYKKIIEILEEHIKVAKKRYEAGFTIELDYLRSEAEKKQLESTLSDFEKFYIRVISSLKTFCNIDTKDEVILVDSLVPDTIFEEKTPSRLDLMILIKNIEMLDYNKKSAYSNFMPKVFGSVNFNYGKPYGFFRDVWDYYFQYNLYISFPLFDFSKRLDEIRKREADKKALEYLLDFTKKKIEEDIISAKKEFESAINSFEFSKKSLELTQKSLDISKSQYEKGFISNTDFLDALRKYLEAQVMYLNSLFKLKEAKIKYESTLYGVNFDFGKGGE
ncbi:MAG: TolC family protein [candidate division WOR-3 bacterium]